MIRKPAWLDAGALLRAAPFFFLIVLAAALSYRYHTLLRDQRDRVDHTYEVITKLQGALVGMIDAETGQRGYVLTGNDSYIAPYRKATQEVPASLAALRGLVADNPSQLARLDRVAEIVREKFDELEATVTARRSQGFDAARSIVLDDRGRRSMDALRSTIEAMQSHELALLAERSSAARTTERRLLLITITCAALSLAARLGLALLARRRRS